jgi:hypothetical protein
MWRRTLSAILLYLKTRVHVSDPSTSHLAFKCAVLAMFGMLCCSTSFKVSPAGDTGTGGGSDASSVVSGMGGTTVGASGATGTAGITAGGVTGTGGATVGAGGVSGGAGSRDAAVERASGGSGGTGGSGKCTSFCYADFPCNATPGPMHSCYNDHQYYPRVTRDCSELCGGCPCSGQACELDMSRLIDCPPGQFCVRTSSTYTYVPACAPGDGGIDTPIGTAIDTAIDVQFSPIDAQATPGG